MITKCSMVPRASFPLSSNPTVTPWDCVLQTPIGVYTRPLAGGLYTVLLETQFPASRRVRPLQRSRSGARTSGCSAPPRGRVAFPRDPMTTSSLGQAEAPVREFRNAKALWWRSINSVSSRINSTGAVGISLRSSM